MDGMSTVLSGMGIGRLRGRTGIGSFRRAFTTWHLGDAADRGADRIAGRAADERR